MFENLVVIGRMNERIQLLRAEVERRGMRWADAEVEDSAMTDVNGELVNGASGDEAHAGASQSQAPSAPSAPSGRLTDEELRARLLERLGDDGGEEDEGVHL